MINGLTASWEDFNVFFLKDDILFFVGEVDALKSLLLPLMSDALRISYVSVPINLTTGLKYGSNYG